MHGNIHTQTIEGFWSLVKRGIIGTFHKVSRKYLPATDSDISVVVPFERPLT